jgi:hypothetical protein
MIAISLPLLLGAALVFGIYMLLDGAHNMANASNPDMEIDNGRQIALCLLGLLVLAVLAGAVGIGPLAGMVTNP